MFVYITIDEVISGSAIDADKSPDVMASPENLPDSTSEPNASCGGIIENFLLGMAVSRIHAICSMGHVMGWKLHNVNAGMFHNNAFYSSF